MVSGDHPTNHEIAPDPDASRGKVRNQYNRFARFYDLVEGPQMFLLGVSRLRRQFLKRARGRVLEIAIGTGASLGGYRKDAKLTGIDFSEEMLKRARKRAKRLGREIDLLEMDAESLKLPDNSFDTVVSSLSLCTIPNPIIALQEMARVCREDGRILLFEHGISNRGWLAGWLDRHSESHAQGFGCHWNRDHLSLVREAGLTVHSSERRLLGVIYAIEAGAQ
ncbi:MAG: methyltransferase domain-containing protein [Dehalococcoidales bacterium]